jgi:hypothetical protein
MKSVAKILAAAFIGVVVGLLFRFWIGWAGYASVAAGAVFGIGFLVVAATLGEDAQAADAAWREQAGDLGVSTALERALEDRETGGSGEA